MDNDKTPANSGPNVEVRITPRTDLGAGIYSFVVLPFWFWGHIEQKGDQFVANYRGKIIATSDALHTLQALLLKKTPAEWQQINN